MYNYLIIFVVFILFILLLSFLSHKKNFKIKSGFEVDINNINNIESFNNKLSVEYNLIKNNCFENNKNLTNFINQNGPCKIVNYQNPGNTQYTLNQKTKSYYEISCDNSLNSSYLLYFYIYIENLNINEFNFEKFVKIRMPTKDYSNLLPKINYNIVKKITLGNNKNWYYIKINYNSNENVLDKQIITFNNTQEKCNLYLTDISLYKVLNNAPNFIYNKNLICFIDSIDYSSNNNILHDISGNNNDLYLSNIPKKNENYIELTNTKIDGFTSNNLNSDKFTIMFTINKIQETINDKPSIENNKNNDKTLLSVQGNNQYSFEILIIDDYLYLKQENNKFKSDKQLNYHNKSVITILYDGNKLNIYNDNLNILSKKINKLFLNNKPIIINKNKNINLHLYNILAYNRIVETNELKDIREYFITNQNKKSSNNDILGLTFDNIYDNNNLNNSVIDGFDSKIEKFHSSNEESYEENHDNDDLKMKLNCVSDCNNICNKFLNGSSNQIENYKNCLNNCKNVMNSCKEYCETNNEDNTYCTTSNNNNNNNNENLNCPKVYKKNGKYVVYIPENGVYSGFFTGEKIFSADIDKARNMYAYNFPDCPIPKELISDNNKYKEYCPFTINELNPCNARVCSDVNWNVKNYKDLKASDKCKKVISNYCHVNYDKDENCVCWDPKYKNNKECIEFRKFFEDPNDYCCISSFNIEDHPDIKKYVKKDNIPCWGCNIQE